MKYRAELDGLRAIAVVPVVLFHAGFEFAKSGFVGVDVFFVISGYLITSILLTDMSNERFSIWQFYERRARRILPALLFVVLVTAIFGWFLMTPSQLKDFGQSILAVSLFASNFLFWLKSDYFSPEAEESPLLHTWSLSVEEQFYIFFPPLLFFLWRFGSKPAFYMIAAIAAVSLLLSEWGWRNAPSANFYLAPFRAWELAAGSLAAFIIRWRGIRNSELLGALGLAMVLLSNLVFDPETPFPSMFTLLPVLGVVLLILYCGEGTVTAKLLSHRALVGIGLVSYSAYLWHQPLFAMVRISTPEQSTLLLWGLSILSFVLAVFSWRYVERPFRAKDGLFVQRSTLLGVSAVALMAFAVVGLTSHLTNGFPNRFTLREGVDLQKIAMPGRDNGYCFYSFARNNTLAVGSDGHGCMLNTTNDESGQSIILFGDSFAAHWDPFWQAYGAETNATMESTTTNWCFPALNDVSVAPRNHPSKPQCAINRTYMLENAKRYDAVVLAGAWNNVADAGFTPEVEAFIERILATSDAKVVLVDTPVALHRASVERALYKADIRLVPDMKTEALSRAFWSEMLSSFQDNDRIMFVSRSMLFGKGGALTVTEEGLPYSLEGKHVSIYGATSSFSELLGTDDFERLYRFIEQ